MRDQSAHIIDKGKQVGLSLSALSIHHRPMHTIRLPYVIGQFCLKPPTIFNLCLPVHQSSLSVQTVDCRLSNFHVWTEDLPLFSLPEHRRKRCPLELFLQLAQCKHGIIIQDSRFATVTSAFRIQALQSPPSLLIPSCPTQYRRCAEPAPARIRDIPLTGGLLP